MQEARILLSQSMAFAIKDERVASAAVAVAAAAGAGAAEIVCVQIGIRPGIQQQYRCRLNTRVKYRFWRKVTAAAVRVRVTCSFFHVNLVRTHDIDTPAFAILRWEGLSVLLVLLIVVTLRLSSVFSLCSTFGHLFDEHVIFTPLQQTSTCALVRTPSDSVKSGGGGVE